jgi:hypothetical protein
MKFLKVLYFLLIFLVVGEIIVRLDDRLRPFSQDAQTEFKVDFNESYEWQLVRGNKVPLDDSTYRVLLLGDSYMHGIGFARDSSVAEVLKQKLKASHLPYKRFLVLDATKGANNTLDNYQEYLVLDKVFKPNLVLLGYNENDPGGNMDEDGAKHLSLANVKADHPNVETFGSKLSTLLANSHLLFFGIHQLNIQMKLSGHILSGSDLDKEINFYTQNQPNWVKSEKILDKLMDSTQDRKEHLLVLMLPIYNLLSNHQLFKPVDSAIYHCFTDTSRSNVAVWNTRSFYDGMPVNALTVNKYEEHPSTMVHRMMADSIFNFVAERISGKKG